MALKIRLARGGAKKRPYYRIVIAEATSPRDGRFVEKVGTYNPMLPRDHKDRIILIADRIQHWLQVGAKPTDRVEGFLADAGFLKATAPAVRPLKSLPKAKAQERIKERNDKAQAAIEATAAAAAEAAAAAAMPAEVEAAPVAVEAAPAEVEASASVEPEASAVTA